MISDSFTDSIQWPFAIKWRIPEYSLEEAAFEMKDISTIKVWETSNIPGITYWFHLCPNREGEAVLFINIRMHPNQNVEVYHTFEFESADRTITKTLTFTETLAGGSVICPTEVLLNPDNGYIVDEIMNIKITGVISVEKPRINNRLRSSAAASNPKRSVGKMLWNREHGKDFVVAVEKDEIKIHKCILGAQSAVFDRMFETNMLEGNEGRIEIKDFSFKIVEAAIKLCYDKNLATVSSMEDAFLLLYFFDKYDMQELKADLESSLISQVSAINVCQIATAASQTNCEILKKGCIEYLADCFAKKIPVSNVDSLDSDIAKEILQQSLFTVI